MIQPQLFVNTGVRVDSNFAVTRIEVTNNAAVSNNSPIDLVLNGVTHNIPIPINSAYLNAVFISSYINTTSTHIAYVDESQPIINVRAIFEGEQTDTTIDPLSSGMTFDITNLDDVVVNVKDVWSSCDLNEGVSVTIKDSIKKAKDIGKVFTSYTMPFKLPASKNNNIIFKRFSNNKVYDGYDARRKYDARIKLNGIDFKTGYIKLNKVDLRDGLPVSYSVQFFGELSSLKDVLSESKLKDLTSLNRFTFPYDDSTVNTGFEIGFDVQPESNLGTREFCYVQVTSVPTSDGNITLILDNIPYSIPIIGTGSVSIESTTQSIIDYINTSVSGWTSVINYDGGNDSALILADDIGVKADVSVNSASSVGMTVSTGVFVQGNNTPNNNSSVTIVPNPDGMIKFPFISHTRGFQYTKPAVYDSNGNVRQTGLHRFLTNDEKNRYYRSEVDPFEVKQQDEPYLLRSQDRLTRFDLKPALKLPYIFDAIEEVYPSIIFDKEWMFGSNTMAASPIKDMYLWLHNKKGYLGYLDQDDNVIDGGTFTRLLKNAGAGQVEGEWEHDPADATYDIRSKFTNTSNIYNNFDFNLNVRSISGDGDITAKIIIYDRNTNDILAQEEVTSEATDGDFNVTLSYPHEDENVAAENVGTLFDFYVETEIVSDSSVAEYTPDVDITEWFYRYGTNIIENTNANYITGSGSVTPTPAINLAGLMPDYKIIDFLSDLFKLYNLVAYEVPQLDGSTPHIAITSYDSYINGGVKYDVTKYIDISESSVERVTPFATVKYSFSEPKTFLAIRQKELAGDDFGNVSFDVSNFDEGNTGSNSFIFDGGTYEVKPKLEKMMFERMTATNKDLTSIQWGWHVDDNKENVPEPSLGKPLMIFCVSKKIIANPIMWDNAHVSDKTMIIPSNVSADRSQTLHFNNEYDEYTSVTNSSSLFKNYYSNMIEGIYSPYAKRINVNAMLPPLIFNKITLADTVVIDNISYFIDSMDINITTGRTKFSLLRVTDIKLRLEGNEEGSINWETVNTNWESYNDNWETN